MKLGKVFGWDSILNNLMASGIFLIILWLGDKFVISGRSIAIYLLEPIQVPLWLMLLLIISLIALGVAFFIKKFSIKPCKKAANTITASVVTQESKIEPEISDYIEPEISDYKEDTIFGLIFSWYRDVLGERQLKYFCPTCQTELDSEIPTLGSIRFKCVHCNKTVKTVSESSYIFFDKVWKEIDRRKRTGEWKQNINSNSNSTESRK